MTTCFHGFLSGVLASLIGIAIYDNGFGFGWSLVGSIAVVAICFLHGKHTGDFE